MKVGQRQFKRAERDNSHTHTRHNSSCVRRIELSFSPKSYKHRASESVSHSASILIVAARPKLDCSCGNNNINDNMRVTFADSSAAPAAAVVRRAQISE